MDTTRENPPLEAPLQILVAMVTVTAGRDRSEPAVHVRLSRWEVTGNLIPVFSGLKKSDHEKNRGRRSPAERYCLGRYLIMRHLRIRKSISGRNSFWRVVLEGRGRFKRSRWLTLYRHSCAWLSRDHLNQMRIITNGVYY